MSDDNLNNTTLDNALEQILNDTGLMRQLQTTIDRTLDSTTGTPSTPDPLNTGFIQHDTTQIEIAPPISQSIHSTINTILDEIAPAPTLPQTETPSTIDLCSPTTTIDLCTPRSIIDLCTPPEQKSDSEDIHLTPH